MTHPAEPKHPHVIVFWWRFLTGHHLDGIPRTNAGWFKSGHSPSHQANWWTSKPRIQRMILRWSVVLLPIGILAAIHYAPTVKVNLAIGMSIVFLPYLAHHGVSKAVRMLPRHTLVYVNDNVVSEEANPELHEVALTEQFNDDNDSGLQELYDVTVEDTTADGTRGKRRRS